MTSLPETTEAQKYNKWWSEQYQTLRAENEKLKAQIENRDLNIRNLTSILDSIPPRLESLLDEEKNIAEEDALEHFPVPEVTP